MSTSSDVIYFHVIKNTGISPTEDIGRGYIFLLPKKKLMTSDAYGFGQLNKQISFLYAQLLTKNACMASVENGKTRIINEDKQIDRKKTQEVSGKLHSFKMMNARKPIFVSNCVEKKK